MRLPMMVPQNLQHLKVRRLTISQNIDRKKIMFEPADSTFCGMRIEASEMRLCHISWSSSAISKTLYLFNCYDKQ